MCVARSEESALAELKLTRLELQHRVPALPEIPFLSAVLAGFGCFARHAVYSLRQNLVSDSDLLRRARL